MKAKLIAILLLLAFAALIIVCIFYNGPDFFLQIAPTVSSGQDKAAPEEAVTSSGEQSKLGDTQEITVCVTATGTRYHADGCRYLRESKIPMDLETARKTYKPCSVCNPPILSIYAKSR